MRSLELRSNFLRVNRLITVNERFRNCFSARAKPLNWHAMINSSVNGGDRGGRMMDGRNRPGGLPGLVRTVGFACASILLVSSANAQREMVDRYCVGCHNKKLKPGGIS